MMLGLGAIYGVAPIIGEETSGVGSPGTVRTLRGVSVFGGGNVEMGVVLSGDGLGGKEPSKVNRS